MIGVLIVEDEYLVRIGIKSILADGLNETIHIIADECNGEDGLKIYKRYRPQIVIADIQLPKMNGLEMIKQIRDEDKEVEFIIISCHADFSYAKKAIEYGVSNYIEKSEMDPKQLLEAVEKLSEKILKKKSNQAYSRKDDKIQNKHEQLQKIFLGEVNEQHLIKKILRGLQIPCEFDSFALILFKIEKSENIKIDKNILCTLAEEVMTEKFCGAAYRSARGECYAFISYDKNRYEGYSGCKNYINRVIKEFKRISKSTVKILEVPSFCEITQISAIYNEMERFKKYLLFIDKDSLITLDELKKRINEESIKVFNYDELFRLTVNGEKLEVEKWISNIFGDIKINKYSLVNMNGHCNQLITILNRVMKYYSEYFKNLYPQTYFEYTDNQQNKSIDDIEQWFINIYLEITEYCSRFKFYQGDNNIITQAINFMINNHKEALTLESIANHCNISRVYLSQLFKKETGRTLVDVLKSIRIEKAKLLIELDEYKIYEIAEQVGFRSHSSYFDKVFKNVTGYTPSEYREKNFLK